MERGMQRAERLREMERLYVQRAFSDIEMAERLGVDRSTVFRDRIALETEYPFVRDATGRWKVDRSRYLSGIKLNLHEALALYLAARRASRQTRIAQPHVASALEKLAAALRQPMTERLVKAAGVVLTQTARPERVAVLETIVQAWAEARQVRIRHRSLSARQAHTYTVCPYLIEPSLWSDGAYLIGASDLREGLSTFKIERVEQAELLAEGFELPTDFDEQELLRYAWGIWYAEGEPVTVRLRFAPGEAARRLQESTWHPTQQVQVLPDGGCEWSAQVAEWQEMLPWVRGWGADCQVLAPPELRQALVREAQELAQLYEIKGTETIEKRYYAHSREGSDPSEWQMLKDHLTHTSELAVEFGHDAGVSDLARVAGLLHDLGKYSQAFQRRLAGSKRPVDHSAAGAQEIIHLFRGKPQQPLAELLAYCIAGHHAGLPDGGSPIDLGETGTLQARIQASLEDYSAYKAEINPEMIRLPERLAIHPLKNHMGFSIAFLARMVYSSLVDADFQETEEYIAGEKSRGGHASIEALCQEFNRFLARFEHPQNDINRKRTETLKACLEKAPEKPGFFTLTVPTGGGKTLASMAFALNHAARHGLKRVIYVIPFTSIIEQNAAVFKESLGEENVLEHHSNFDWEQQRKAAGQTTDNLTNSAYTKLKLAAENWDIPIVMTTNVQFFESLFANRYSRCRKLHNIAKSVIIFDEAQMLPREYLLPAMCAVWELVTNYGASAVFCTATQPALQKFLPEGTQFIELASNPQELFNFYKRVQVTNKDRLLDAELLEQMNAQPQTLCIVNTRRHAKGLFDGLSEAGRFHLSTLMCPAHRKATLLDIRERLKNGQPCRVVSTQVMEAGIDVDFPAGFRSLAGLDAIIQAAGRVNREGKLANGGMYVFEPDSELVKRVPKFIEQGAAVARSILREFPADPVSIAAIEAYYGRLYSLHDDQHAFDAKEILACFDRSEGFEFKTAAERFQVVEHIMSTVIIPFNQEAVKLIDELKYTPYPVATLRKLQPYTVNIYEQEFQALNAKGAIEMVADVYAILSDMGYYHPQTGLLIPESGGGEAVFL